MVRCICLPVWPLLYGNWSLPEPGINGSWVGMLFPPACSGDNDPRPAWPWVAESSCLSSWERPLYKSLSQGSRATAGAPRWASQAQLELLGAQSVTSQSRMMSGLSHGPLPTTAVYFIMLVGYRQALFIWLVIDCIVWNKVVLVYCCVLTTIYFVWF